ncbi:rhomboid family intramembrane serine protease [Hymenobacter sp. BT491]|uniref:rhomboid family intramembrane serine protease n=1 Tax=Hymenobacter sp. BT491 TaxID=2766779 RepID=UPI001653A784|nr:rhomboid family intramembrane serine protease [Hymenobacter sp. BT491]MBC6990367.1 rhomboid family intramembrane serine protease [Hymenobacter sp. BT491]
MAEPAAPNEHFAQKSDAELLYLVQNPQRYPQGLVQAAVQELQRRELIPRELPDAEKPALAPVAPPDESTGQLARKLLQTVFWPTKTYFVTPLLIDTNLLVFALMALSGVNVFTPAGVDLVAWGSNFSPLTLPGQPWRLLTSCFLHGGPAHLLLNLSALLFLGLLSEPLVGRGRLLLVYVCSGVGGSLFSLAWHTQGVNSVGASGAIFGLYGLLLALAALRAVPMSRAERLSLLWFMLYMVLNSLVAGLEANTDNAAHVGGLITGLFAGALLSLCGLPKPPKQDISA